MVPSNLLSLLFFLIAIAPGYVFVRVAERRRVRPVRSTLLETAEVLVIGAVCTGLGVVIVAAAQTTNRKAFLNFTDLVQQGSSLLQDNPARTARTLALVVAVSWAVAAVAARAVHGRAASIVPGATVWQAIVGNDPTLPVFASASLRDGSIVEGYVLAHPVGTTDVREIALQSPIYFTPKFGERTKVVNADRALLLMEDVVRLGFRYDRKTQKQPRNRGRVFRRRTKP